MAVKVVVHYKEEIVLEAEALLNPAFLAALARGLVDEGGWALSDFGETSSLEVTDVLFEEV